MGISEKETIQQKRIYWCHVRLTESEYQDLQKKRTTTTCRDVSTYVRRVLFEKPVTVKQRNQSMDDFMGELIILRRELNAIGNNFNQVVRKINSTKTAHEVSVWLPVAESMQRELLAKVNHIQERISEFAAQWFPK